MERTTRQKVSKKTQDLNNTISQIDLTDLKRRVYTATKYTFLPSTQGTFLRIDNMVVPGLSLNRF